jgi:hypothetical protein
MNLPQARTAINTRVLYDGQCYLVKAAQEARDWQPEAPMQDSDFEVYRVEADGLQMFAAWLADTSQSFRAAYLLALCAQSRNPAVRFCLRTADELARPFVFAYAS